MSNYYIVSGSGVNNTGYFGYYGNKESLPLGTVPFDPWVIVDGPQTDKALPSGIFAYNNDRPIGSRLTSIISKTNNDALLNMDNTTTQSDGYPGKNLFGNENTSQYIYSNNPRKDRIGVF